MNSVISKYISNCRAANSDKVFTHTSLFTPTGKYNISRQYDNKFWDLYCEQLSKLGDEFLCGLTEVPSKYIPMLCDVDISTRLTEDIEINIEEKLYEKKHIKAIVKIYQEILSLIVEDLDSHTLTCFVLEKTKPHVKNETLKNGFHLHFPFLFLNVTDIEIYILPRIIKEVEDLDVFGDLKYPPISLNFIDKAVVKNNWLLYGSRKDPLQEAYKLTCIYDKKRNEITLESLRNKFFMTDIFDDSINFKNANLEYMLPRILSITNYGRKIYSIKTGVEILDKKNLLRVTQVKRTFEDMPAEEGLKIAAKYLPLLSDTRATENDYWIRVGWALWTIGAGSIEAYDMWVNFSKRTVSNNFDEGVCFYQWKRMTPENNHTIGTIKGYAREDSPAEYEKLYREEQSKLIEASLLGGHANLAKQLHDKFKDEYVCADAAKNVWFEFKDHRWVETQCGLSLRAKIATFLIPRYNEEGQKLYRMQTDLAMAGEDNSIRITECIKKHAQIQKIVGSLNHAQFKECIMKECKQLFFNPEFWSKLDQDKYLLGFNNGVLDIKELEFRDGRPEDYISMSTGYDFKEYDEESQEVLEVKEFLLKVLPDKNLRTYFLEYSAKLLKGGNFSKNFVVMSGEGDAGKSMTIELIEHALGQYSIKLPTSLLTGKRTQSSQASPELARSRGVRFCVLQEPDGKDEINAGLLKELTGNDKFYNRGLYSGGGDILPMFKLVLVCNKLPRLPAEDQATWNRVRVLTFESNFPKDPSIVPPTFEEQLKRKIFYRDPTLSDKFPYMKSAFMWIMFNTFKYIKKYGETPEPDKVINATTNYRKNNDYILQYIDDRIKEDHSESCLGLNINEIYIDFKDWFRETYNNIKLPSKIDVKEDLFKKWGASRGNRWKHYRFKNDRDEEEEGTLILMDENDFTDFEEESRENSTLRNTNDDEDDIEELVIDLNIKEGEQRYPEEDEDIEELEIE